MLELTSTSLNTDQLGTLRAAFTLLEQITDLDDETILARMKYNIMVISDAEDILNYLIDYYANYTIKPKGV